MLLSHLAFSLPYSISLFSSTFLRNVGLIEVSGLPTSRWNEEKEKDSESPLGD